MNKNPEKTTSVEKTDKRPCFSISARPLSVDVGILNLEPDTEILIFTSLAGLSGRTAYRAKDAIEDIERIIKRQAKGRYTMLEVAEIMAAAHNLDACDFLKTRMYPAYESGALKLLDPKDGGLVRARQCKEYDDWVTPANLDKWLETEFECRWPVTVVPESAPGSLEPDKARPIANWKMQIQIEATALTLRLRQSGASPTKHSILGNMVKWCLDNNVKTDGKIFPTAGYIRTHVLGGKHWDLPK